MTALVTGGTGFVGAAIVRALLARGAAVRALVRAGNDRRNLEGLDVALVEGDLLDPDSLARALDGIDSLYHAAADYRLWVPDPDAMHAVNVKGTRSLMEAAKAAGVKRIVYTSSVATLGTCRSGAGANETTPATLAEMVGPYKRSKFLAEQMVRDMTAEGLPAVIVNPSAPVGPRDIKPTPTGRMVRHAAEGKIPAFVDTGLNLVHVEDVAAGHLLAHDHGQIGERYILGGENMTLQDMLTLIRSLTGQKGPAIRLPRRALYPLAAGAEAWARLRGTGEPIMSVTALQIAGRRMFYSSAKAERELGYRHRPAEEALRAAIRWFGVPLDS